MKKFYIFLFILAAVSSCCKNDIEPIKDKNDIVDLWYDYVSLIDANYESMVSANGKEPDTWQNNGVYMYSLSKSQYSDNLRRVFFQLNPSTQVIERIQIDLLPGVSQEKILAYMKARYYYVSNMDGLYFFTSSKSKDNSNAYITYDTKCNEVIINKSGKWHERQFIAYDYERFLGVNRQTIQDAFEFLYYVDGDDMVYNTDVYSVADSSGLVKDSNWKYLFFRFDMATGLVKAISLIARDSIWFTPNEMTEYLSRKYHVYEKGTEETFRAFINSQEFSDATAGITWDTENKILTYVAINTTIDFNPFEYYGSFMNKNRDEVHALMNGMTPLSETEERIGYAIESEYVRMVRFSFLSGSQIMETVQEVIVYLRTDIDSDMIREKLEEVYTYINSLEGRIINYESKDKDMRIIYNLDLNLVQYLN